MKTWVFAHQANLSLSLSLFLFLYFSFLILILIIIIIIILIIYAILRLTPLQAPTDALGAKLQYPTGDGQSNSMITAMQAAMNYPFPMQLLAVTTILQGCTPGGSTSNFYAYFTRGDVALSVCMTMMSTLCAFFMMPLLLWAYGSQALGISVDAIPIKDMVQQLGIVLVPVFLGIYIRARTSPIIGELGTRRARGGSGWVGR